MGKSKNKEVIQEAFSKRDLDPGKKNLYILVGVAGCGKSTWSNKQEDSYIVSMDEQFEKSAAKNGIAYNECFLHPPLGSKEGDFISEFEHLGQVVPDSNSRQEEKMSYELVMKSNRNAFGMFMGSINKSMESGQNIILDMTNLRPRKRKEALAYFEKILDNYNKIAVVFELREAKLEELYSRLEKRKEILKNAGIYKDITPELIDQMLDMFLPVTKNEMFDQAWVINNFE